MVGVRLRVGDGLLVVAAAQIGMDHVALDRPRPNDGDLHHEVVELPRPQARQHRHLGPALDLEHADGIGARQHRVDLRVLRRQVGQGLVALSVILLQEGEAAPQAAQHPECQHVHLHQADHVDVVLVPLDEGAPRHRAVADRHGLVEALARQHEAADMLREVARETDERGGEIDRLPDRGVLRVEAGSRDMGVRQILAPRAPDRVGERRRDVLGEAQHLADLADGRARAVMDHGRADRGALAPVLRVQVLDHLLAALVLEIDIDVGRLVAVLGDEAGEEQPDLGGIDRRDAEAVADGRVRRRAAALAEDAPGAGELHHVEEREEVAGVVHRRDEPELLAQGRLHLSRNALGEAPAGELEGLLLQVALGGAAGRHRLVRVLVGEVAEREAAGFGDLDRAGERGRVVCEEPGHRVRRLQVALGIGLEAVAGLGQGAALADAGDDVLKRPPVRMVVERVRHRHERGAEPVADLGEAPEPGALVAAPPVAAGEIGPAGRRLGEPRETVEECVRRLDAALGRQRDQDLSGRGPEHRVEAEAAFAFPGAPVARREQAAEPAVGRAIHRVGDRLEPVLGDEAHARQEADPPGLGIAGPARPPGFHPRRRVGAHQTGRGVAVRDADGGEPVSQRLLDVFLGVRGAAQEGEVRLDGEFRVTRHTRPSRSSISRRGRPARAARGAPAPPATGWRSAARRGASGRSARRSPRSSRRIRPRAGRARRRSCP
ncbi:hypothetical protein NBEOAGPD_5130 [Methylobacterium gregans]|uniref:Uncharacterized protein n=1 Tax=Methylobacterium gregans TaxID=374424 RepID=A0AA37HTT8_9HYPH|nr:hypothetical protein NBEOAGPD_5130 [Methylobacterium gregans]